MLHVLGASTLVACGGRVDTRDDGTPSDPSPSSHDPDAGAGDPDAVVPDEAGSCDGQDYGAVDEFPESAFILRGTRSATMIIGRDGDGLFAMTGLCTHARCPLVARGTGDAEYWYCDCHGARFGFNGESQRRVAPRPLTHYAVNVCDGRVLVDRATPVDPSVRKSVP